MFSTSKTCILKVPKKVKERKAPEDLKESIEQKELKDPIKQISLKCSYQSLSFYTSSEFNRVIKDKNNYNWLATAIR